jgi:C4-dicarboxylate-specific signal transduction histidine kinase
VKSCGATQPIANPLAMPLDDLIGSNPSRFKSGKHPQSFYKGLWDVISSGVTWHGEIVNKSKDGRLFYLDLTITPITAKNGRVEHYIGIGKDITEKRSLQNSIMHAERVATLGRLAGGIAHEVNNPLATIITSLELTIQSLSSLKCDQKDQVDKLIKICQTSLGSANRASQVLKDLSYLSNEKFISAPVVDMNKTITAALTMLKSDIDQTCKVETKLKGIRNIRTAESNMGQFILNVLSIALRTFSKKDREDNFLSIQTEMEGDAIRITVDSNGLGLEQDVIDNMWDPFYSTDTMNVARGLSLGISTMIINDLGGSFSITQPYPSNNSSPRVGTRFLALIPTGDEVS